ncbi:transglycosylase SLT domain-containing protein [Candidatus Nitrospira bockiana]
MPVPVILSVALWLALAGPAFPTVALAQETESSGRLSVSVPLIVADFSPAVDLSALEADSEAAEPGDDLEETSPGEELASESPSLEPLLGADGEPTLRVGPSNLPSRFSDLLDPSRSALAPGDARLSEPEAAGGILELPIVRNDKVESHIRFFHIAIRDRFEQWLTRLGHYKPLVESIFSEFNLPSDLVYLSLVESGFNPHAYSRARATGPWQFMKGTAKLYGLRVDRYVDERRDPIKSTVAAARYLRDLYDLFGTWPLAMAAYNAGEGKVMRALQKARADSFWEIAQTKHLRRETKEYVPRFMAATIIAKNPDQYGFVQDPPEPHQFEEVIVPHSISLRALAEATGTSLYELRRLNPELRLDVTPPDDEHYHLKVPVGSRPLMQQAIVKLPAWKPAPAVAKNVKTKGRVEPAGSYRVRVGDTLWTIAKRFNMSVAQLKARNRLAGHGIRPGDLLTISPPR